MSKTQLILLQAELSARKRLLKKFNGDSKRIQELDEKIKVLSVQIKALS